MRISWPFQRFLSIASQSSFATTVLQRPSRNLKGKEHCNDYGVLLQISFFMHSIVPRRYGHYAMQTWSARPRKVDIKANNKNTHRCSTIVEPCWIIFPCSSQSLPISRGNGVGISCGRPKAIFDISPPDCETCNYTNQKKSQKVNIKGFNRKRCVNWSDSIQNLRHFECFRLCCVCWSLLESLELRPCPTAAHWCGNG